MESMASVTSNHYAALLITFFYSQTQLGFFTISAEPKGDLNELRMGVCPEQLLASGKQANVIVETCNSLWSCCVRMSENKCFAFNDILSTFALLHFVGFWLVSLREL